MKEHDGRKYSSFKITTGIEHIIKRKCPRKECDSKKAWYDTRTERIHCSKCKTIISYGII